MARAIRKFRLRDEFKNAAENFAQEEPGGTAAPRRLGRTAAVSEIKPPLMFVSENDPRFFSDEEMLDQGKPLKAARLHANTRKQTVAYKSNCLVQKSAVEVVLLMSKLQGPLPLLIAQGDLCSVIVDAMLQFPKDRAIQWKVSQQLEKHVQITSTTSSRDASKDLHVHPRDSRYPGALRGVRQRGGRQRRRTHLGELPRGL
eukprot:scaffold3319_cov258-Pinguiococcus_pyrenoidosus.AAC.11